MGNISGRTILAAALVGLPSAFYPSTPAAAPVNASSRTLVVTSYEFAFKAPDSIAAGVVTVRLVNRGKEGHQVSFARLDDSSSMLRVMRTLVADKERTRGIKWIGGVERAIAGNSSETTLELLPGRYLIVCAYHADDNHAHVSKGMIRPLIVTGAAGEAGPLAVELPAAPVTIRLTDYHFAMSGPLRAGRQLVRVQNDGAHMHQLSLSRFIGKNTLKELDAWDGKSKPSPIDEVGGGAAVMDPGEAAVVALDLRPGRYVVDCGLSDTTGAKPHYLLGMEQEITVR